MSSKLPRITPFLWFESQAEEAAQLYTSIFPNSKIGTTVRYTKEVAQQAGRPEGSVMTIDFELDGIPMSAINGGPHFKFNEAVSLVVNCESQKEVDYYWERLSAGGDPKAQQCGWLKDRFGLSWQVVPTELGQYLGHPDPEKAKRATQAMLQMKKLDLEELERAVS
jgi:predicted 3-demethylubiquinone-9 3-methyltransferase (glyoxalase superfamily)